MRQIQGGLIGPRTACAERNLTTSISKPWPLQAQGSLRSRTRVPGPRNLPGRNWKYYFEDDTQLINRGNPFWRGPKEKTRRPGILLAVSANSACQTRKFVAVVGGNYMPEAVCAFGAGEQRIASMTHDGGSSALRETDEVGDSGISGQPVRRRISLRRGPHGARSLTSDNRYSVN